MLSNVMCAGYSGEFSPRKVKLVLNKQGLDCLGISGVYKWQQLCIMR